MGEPATESVATTLHVVPVGDVVEHDTSPDCICGPTLDTVRPAGTRSCDCGCVPEQVGMTWVHHSLDGREASE